MIIEKEVMVSINNRNKKYYRNKGYVCNDGDKMVIPIADLYTGSHIIIHAKCDNPNCDSVKPLRYETYNRFRNSSVSHLYYCNKCVPLRKAENIKQSQADGNLTRENVSYWAFEENRIKEFLNYIKKYKTLEFLSKKDMSLFTAILQYEGGNLEFIRKLKLDEKSLLQGVRKPNNYYTKEIIIASINDFIYHNNRFPSRQELYSLYGIGGKQFNRYFKDCSECKKEIGYYNKDDLVDNRGDVNKSYYELYTANFLIAQGLENKYTREEYPFDGYYYKSDFTLYPENKKLIHIEVWADNEDKQLGSNFFKKYLETRRIKEKLYKLNSNEIALISIEPTVFTGSLRTIEKRLYNIFKDYINLKYKTINVELLLAYNSMSEDEIVQLLYKYSEDKNRFATVKEIIKHKGGYSLLNEIRRRFGGLTCLYEKYGCNLFHSDKYWSDLNVFKCFDYMINTYGKFYSVSDYNKNKDNQIKGIYQHFNRNGGYIIYKIKYIQYKIENENINSYLLNHLKDIANNSIPYFLNRVAPEQQQQAQQILDQYNQKIKQSA